MFPKLLKRKNPKLFNPKVEIVGKVPEFKIGEVMSEPMLFSADLDFAFSEGGTLTKSFIKNLPSDYLREKVVIDSKVVMLKKGWFPCIPGWHLDEIPQTCPNNPGQPNLKTPEYTAEHIMCLVGDEISNTLFVNSPIELDVPTTGTIWVELDRQINKKLSRGSETINVFRVPMNTLVKFDHESFHKGQRANGDGWRWFIRATKGSNRQPINKIRTQVQVYIESENTGW
jgi:hypothetical protein